MVILVWIGIILLKSNVYKCRKTGVHFQIIIKLSLGKVCVWTEESFMDILLQHIIQFKERLYETVNLYNVFRIIRKNKYLAGFFNDIKKRFRALINCTTLVFFIFCLFERWSEIFKEIRKSNLLLFICVKKYQFLCKTSFFEYSIKAFQVDKKYR